MLLILDFFRDLDRFRRHRILFTAVWILLKRPELIIWGALVVALAYTSYLKNEPEVWVLWTVFVLILLHFLFVSFVVKFLTPIYFGFLAFGRLKKIEHWAKPGPITFASFVEVPSGNELHVNIMGVWPVRGTVGTTYLLLRHPSNVKIVLPILDDDPIYRSHVLNLATARRRQEIEMQLQKLRS